MPTPSSDPDSSPPSTGRTYAEGKKIGFRVEEILDFNRLTTPAWWINGGLLRRRHFSRVQLKFVNHLTWLIRLLDRVLPWHGTSLIAVARRGPEPETDSVVASS